MFLYICVNLHLVVEDFCSVFCGFMGKFNAMESVLSNVLEIGCVYVILFLLYESYVLIEYFVVFMRIFVCRFNWCSQLCFNCRSCWLDMLISSNFKYKVFDWSLLRV